MQRKREQELRQQLEDEQRKQIKESHWVVGSSLDDDVKYKLNRIQVSFIKILFYRIVSASISEVFSAKTINTGRKSFGHFNPVIDVCLYWK